MQNTNIVKDDEHYIKSVITGLDAIAEVAKNSRDRILKIRKVKKLHLGIGGNILTYQYLQGEAIKEEMEKVKRNVEWILYDE